MRQLWFGLGLVCVGLFVGCSQPVSDPTTYQVSYVANGGTGSVPIDGTGYHAGATVTVLGGSGLVNGGNALAGWTTKTDGTGISYAAGATFTMNAANVTLCAVWLPGNLTFASSGTSIAITGYTPLTSPPSGALVIPGGVTGIHGGLFSGVSGLTSVSIPASITCISGMSFDGDTGLQSVTIASGVLDIAESAFESCRSLNNVIIPSSVTNIGVSAFQDCSSLTSVTVEAITPPTLPSSSEAFYECAASLKIYVPSASVSAYESAAGWIDYASKITSL